MPLNLFIVVMNQPEREIILASPRGFCAGVDRAIEVVERALELYSPLYVNHEIVHNKHVVEKLRNKGVIFVEDIEKVPEGETVIFSAHGVSPALWQTAEERNLNVIDATCPLVTKVHLEVKRYAREGKEIVLIGHKNHVEAIGTMGEAPERISIVESVDDVDALNYPENTPLAYITQTTLSVLDTKEIIDRLEERFPQIEGPSSSDICYATTNRQEAVAVLAPDVDLVLVIGSKNSSNSNRLRELAEKMGAEAHLVDGARFINADMVGDSVRKIGVTAGASAPENLVEEVINHLKINYGFSKVSELNLKKENTTFKLPKNLREAIAASA